jgi:hypothetical protein
VTFSKPACWSHSCSWDTSVSFTGWGNGPEDEPPGTGSRWHLVGEYVEFPQFAQRDHHVGEIRHGVAAAID